MGRRRRAAARTGARRRQGGPAARAAISARPRGAGGFGGQDDEGRFAAQEDGRAAAEVGNGTVHGPQAHEGRVGFDRR